MVMRFGGDEGVSFIIRYDNMMACWKKPWELSYLELNIFMSKKWLDHFCSNGFFYKRKVK